MAKLSADIIETGRGYLRSNDYPGFMAWVSTHAPNLRTPTFRNTFEKVLAYGDTEKALAFFNTVLPDYDPVAEAKLALLRIILLGILTLGVLGGVVYLFRVIFF